VGIELFFGDFLSMPIATGVMLSIFPSTCGDYKTCTVLVQDALAALDTIKEADVAYIRKLGNPPGAIKLVMEAVCVILGVKPAKGKDESGKPFDDWWKPSVALLNEKDFLQKLKSYDKDNIPAKV
jgi:dynein heavy chain, axonemal